MLFFLFFFENGTKRPLPSALRAATFPIGEGKRKAQQNCKHQFVVLPLRVLLLRHGEEGVEVPLLLHQLLEGARLGDGAVFQGENPVIAP